MIRVLIVDDHPVVRSGLRTLLEGRDGIVVVGEAGDGAEAIAMSGKSAPDVVLCDLRLGDGIDGVGVARRLRVPTGPAVVILTTYDHDTDIMRAVEAGAAGYLLKDAPPEVIVRAVELAAAGESVLTTSQTERVIASMRTGTRDLSEREREVIVLLADGLTNREIARRLFLSEATVKTHLAHAYDKLGVTNRTAAVAAARREGLGSGA